VCASPCRRVARLEQRPLKLLNVFAEAGDTFAEPSSCDGVTEICGGPRVLCVLSPPEGCCTVMLIADLFPPAWWKKTRQVAGVVHSR